MSFLPMFHEPGTDRWSMGRSSGWILMALGTVLQVGTFVLMWAEATGAIKCKPETIEEMPMWAGAAMIALGGLLYSVTKITAGPVSIETDKGGKE